MQQIQLTSGLIPLAKIECVVRHIMGDPYSRTSFNCENLIIVNWDFFYSLQSIDLQE